MFVHIAKVDVDNQDCSGKTDSQCLPTNTPKTALPALTTEKGTDHERWKSSSCRLAVLCPSSLTFFCPAVGSPLHCNMRQKVVACPSWTWVKEARQKGDTCGGTGTANCHDVGLVWFPYCAALWMLSPQTHCIGGSSQLYMQAQPKGLMEHS